ncbi:MAG: DoxX family protein [Actinomycetota bacterium]|nr:DoxX family protein [Actinomycetota bacterium]
MKYLVLLGRVLYSWIFLTSVPEDFKASIIGLAAKQGVPFAHVAVPLAGITALLGSLSIIFGFKAKWGAWLLVLFLVLVTPAMHNFWAIKDPMMAMIQRVSFMKNVSMLGAALIIAYFGSGPLSLDRRP